MLLFCFITRNCVVGKSYTEEDAIHEIVARASEDMFANSETVQEILDSMTAEEKQTFVGKVKKILAQFKQWISELLGLYKSDSAEAESLRKAANNIDELIKMWDDMLKKSLTANKALETAKARENKNSANKDGVVQYSFKEYSEHQKENWKNSKKIVLYENENQYRSFIETSILDKQFNKKIYFGAITKSQAERIKIDTNIDVENYNCSLSANEIRKMFKDHGSAEKESLRGQRAITVTDVVQIPQVLLSPDKISLSSKTYNGKPVINFVKNTDGTMTVSAVVSDKHLDLFVQTAFAGIKKGNLATPIAEQAAINTSETSSGTVSANSIPNSSKKINDKTVNNEDVEFAEKNPDLTDKDLDDYIKTGKTLHTRNKKQRMLENGKKPILTSYIEFKEFISKVIEGKAPGEVRAFKKVGKRLAKAIQNKRNNLNVFGKYVELNADDLRESYKRHSVPKEMGDIPLSERDFERIPEYLDDFDDVLSVNTYNNKVEAHLYKETEEGYIRILTVVSSERNSLQITKLVGVSKEKFEKKYAKKIEGNIGSLWSQLKDSFPSTTAQLTADVPSSTSILDSAEESNEEFVNIDDLQKSDKTTETDTDLLKSLLDEEELRSFKEREALYQNKIKRLSEQLKSEKKPSKGKVYEHNISGTAAHLLEHYGSKYKKSELVKDLDELYDRMIALPGTVKDFAYGIASKVYDGITAKKTIDENAASLLAELKTRRIKLDSEQLAKIENSHGDGWRTFFRNRVVIDNKNGTPLDEVWKELSDTYPDRFVSDISSADQPTQLLDIIDDLMRESEVEEVIDAENFAEDFAEELFDSFWNLKPYTTAADKYEQKLAELRKRNIEKSKARTVQIREKLAEQKSQARSERRKADKAEILEDLKRFKEYIKLEKKYAHSKHIDPNTLNMVTKWLREKADKRRTLQSKSERFTPISNKTRCIYTIIRMRFRKILLLNL